MEPFLLSRLVDKIDADPGISGQAEICSRRSKAHPSSRRS
jgi:hypothetical protein